jgi:hypothetical protein
MKTSVKKPVRTVSLKVRVSPEELSTLVKTHGSQRKAIQYMRSKGIPGDQYHVQSAPAAAKKADAELTRQIQACGRNLNQGIRALS